MCRTQLEFHQEILSEVELKAFNRMSQDVTKCDNMSHEREREGGGKSPFALVQ